MQILRHHADMLTGSKPSRLRAGQRYHFAAGWLPWIADGINLIFTLAAIVWSVAMILYPKKVDPPLLELSILPLALFSFKAIKMIYIYRMSMRTSISRTIAAGLAGLALAHTIAKAVLWGFVTKDIPFFRTPKLSGKTALFQSIATAGQEWMMLFLLLGSTIGVAIRSLSVTPDLNFWIAVLLMQCTPYIAAVVVSLMSAFPYLPARLVGSLPDNRDA
jgi:hypothetical protein